MNRALVGQAGSLPHVPSKVQGPNVCETTKPVQGRTARKKSGAFSFGDATMD